MGNIIATLIKAGLTAFQLKGIIMGLAKDLRLKSRQARTPQFTEQRKQEFVDFISPAADAGALYVWLMENERRDLYRAMATAEGLAYLLNEGFYVEENHGYLVIWFDHASINTEDMQATDVPVIPQGPDTTQEPITNAPTSGPIEPPAPEVPATENSAPLPIQPPEVVTNAPPVDTNPVIDPVTNQPQPVEPQPEVTPVTNNAGLPPVVEPVTNAPTNAPVTEPVTNAPVINQPVTNQPAQPEVTQPTNNAVQPPVTNAPAVEPTTNAPVTNTVPAQPEVTQPTNDAVQPPIDNSTPAPVTNNVSIDPVTNQPVVQPTNNAVQPPVENQPAPEPVQPPLAEVQDPAVTPVTNNVTQPANTPAPVITDANGQPIEAPTNAGVVPPVETTNAPAATDVPPVVDGTGNAVEPAIVTEGSEGAVEPVIVDNGDGTGTPINEATGEPLTAEEVGTDPAAIVTEEGLPIVQPEEVSGGEPTETETPVTSETTEQPEVTDESGQPLASEEAPATDEEAPAPQENRKTTARKPYKRK